MELFKGTRLHLKPYQYPWMHEAHDTQVKLHWHPAEVSLQNDVVAWKSELTDSEKHILTQVQLYLANADSDVAGCYVQKYLPVLTLPEAQQMLLTIAAMEAIHIDSYALTIDTLGMDESSYSAFLEIPEMREKHDFLMETRAEEHLSEVQRFMLDIAICSAFGEGLQLFSAFVIILSFMRRGLMTGMGQLTTFIARDENLHCEAMIRVFNTIKQEHPEAWTDTLVEYISIAATKAVELEDHFIDLTFKMGNLGNLTAEEVKNYIRYVGNKRLHSLGIVPPWDQPTNPVPWMDELLGAPEHANFFEARSSSYSKANYSGSWSEAWQTHDTAQGIKGI